MPIKKPCGIIIPSISFNDLTKNKWLLENHSRGAKVNEKKKMPVEAGETMPENPNKALIQEAAANWRQTRFETASSQDQADLRERASGLYYETGDGIKDLLEIDMPTQEGNAQNEVMRAGDQLARTEQYLANLQKQAEESWFKKMLYGLKIESAASQVQALKDMKDSADTRLQKVEEREAKLLEKKMDADGRRIAEQKLYEFYGGDMSKWQGKIESGGYTIDPEAIKKAAV